MILLDTHVWGWWVHGDSLLPNGLRAVVDLHAPDGIAVSAISCWEVAKLVERGRLQLPMGLLQWMDFALEGSGVGVIPLSPQIAVASTTLPGSLHRDPADQLIVATSRTNNLALVTLDQKIRSYPHVQLVDDAQIHDR